MPRRAAAFLSLLLVPSLAAQAPVPVVPASAMSKQATAARLSGPGIRVDGRLDDPAWATATFISDFTMKEPVQGAAPGDRTEVAFLYDDEALYIGARMQSRQEGGVPRGLTRRDGYGNAEHIVVSLDPFLDRRTAYSFAVTAGNGRRDYYHPRDSEDFPARDFTWDPIWEGRADVAGEGWTAEFRIPFSQLRFNDQAEHTWGLNINRWIPQRNEDIYWVVVPRDQAGFASRFGTLTGIRGLPANRRMEVLPYVAANSTIRGETEPGNPFSDRTRTSGRVGGDLKVGLGPSLTLDATVNPDFGQVEADPAQVNLSAFETIFGERRPFFTEGGELLRGNVQSYFYSRRIGGAPRGRASGDFVDTPPYTTILGAAKVTGRLGSDWSLGLLTAVTGRERARTWDAGTQAFGDQEVEPRAQWMVARLQRQFGADASTLGISLAGMSRHFGEGSGLREVLSSRAVSGGPDWILRFQEGRYELSGHVGFSYVGGSPAAMQRIQTSSAHYFQRPDATHLGVDPDATALWGYTATIRGDKNAGNWLWGIQASTESEGFETNDTGRLQSADDLDLSGDINHRWTTPGALFRRAQLGIFARSSWNYGGDRTGTDLQLFSNAQFANFWEGRLNLGYVSRGLRDDLTRGGPLMRSPERVYAVGSVSTSQARATSVALDFDLGRGEYGSAFARIGLRGNAALSPRVSASLSPSVMRDIQPRQYIGRESGGPAATYGTRYLFSEVNLKVVALQARLNYLVSPTMSLEVYAEPFAASGRYRDLGELTAARRGSLRYYGRAAGTTITAQADGYRVQDAANGGDFVVPYPDFRSLSFRSNLVFRWEWSAGSTLFLVWQQNRGDGCGGSPATSCDLGGRPGSGVGGGSLVDALRANGDNFLAAKVSYWLPVR